MEKSREVEGKYFKEQSYLSYYFLINTIYR